MNPMKTVIQISTYASGIIYRRCPHCGALKRIEDFGFRRMRNGTVRNQSWCRKCRCIYN